MHYYFRSNLNSKIGLGHFSRIQYLVNLFKNKNCTVILDKLNNKILQNYKKIRIKEIYEKNSKFINEFDDAKKFKKFLKHKSKSIVIVDDYRLSFKWEKYVSNSCRKIVCIDDYINRKHYSDFYLNTKPDFFSITKKNMEIIRNNNKKNCVFLLGPKFCLINPILKKKIRYIKKFSLTFYSGGSRSILIYKKIIFKLLKKNIKNLQINLIVGPLSKDINKVINTYKIYKTVKVIINNNNLSNILSNTDLLIAPAGVIVYESALFKIPTILINMTEDQENKVEGLEKIGHYFFLEKKDLKNTPKFLNLLVTILTHYKRVLKLTKNPEIKINRNSKTILKILNFK